MQVKTTSALEQELSACANFHQFLSENAPAQQTPALAEVLQRALAACGMSRAEVIRRIGKENLHVLATKEKLFHLRGRALLVDTGSEAVDKMLCGYIRVIVDYQEEQMCRIGTE